METLSGWGLATVVVGGIATLAIFSFLIKENAFYRFFEHLFIGIAAGLAPMLTLRDFLWPQVLEPMFGGSIIHYPDGTQSEAYQPLYLLYLIPMAFGLLYYTLYSKRYSWLAKVVIGFTLGASGALAIRGFFAEVIPQLAGSAKPLVVFEGPTSSSIAWGASLNNLLFVGILLVVLYYFFFTLSRTNSGEVRSAKLGRPLLMVCFGAFFGSTVMARLALLVERVQFIIRDWFSAVSTLLGVGG
jgi:hypothetical protein